MKLENELRIYFRPVYIFCTTTRNALLKYMMIPIICVEYLAFAWRFYWRHGDFYSYEHHILCSTVAIVQILSIFSHRAAMYQDPGFVQKHHFKDEEHGIQYQIENEAAQGVNDREAKLCRVESCRALKVKGVHHCS